MENVKFKDKIIAKDKEIEVLSTGDDNDYISLTDIAKYKSENPDDVIKNWMRNKDVIEFLGLWETIHNESFKPVEFDGFKKQAGSNAFTMSPSKWIEKTSAVGLISKRGRYGGTYAHKDIAFEFASWISAEFKLYIITDYQRLKNDENSRLSMEWNLTREISKLNYRIHTDAIEDKLIVDLPAKYQNIVYATGADVLNVAMFGITAKDWRKANPDSKGNLRDHATLHQLIVLSNLESINSNLIHKGVEKLERVKDLNTIAKQQMTVLLNTNVEQVKNLGVK